MHNLHRPPLMDVLDNMRHQERLYRRAAVGMMVGFVAALLGYHVAPLLLAGGVLMGWAMRTAFEAMKVGTSGVIKPEAWLAWMSDRGHSVSDAPLKSERDAEGKAT